MEATITAEGTTIITLVTNMKRFVKSSEQMLSAFTNLRGTSDFANVLHAEWPKFLENNEVFHQVKPISHTNGLYQLSPEIIGFATGAFRYKMYEEYTSPAYEVDKNKISLTDVDDNFQFKKLFREVWKQWRVSIRPTVTGMFVVQLHKEYSERQHLIDFATDVLKTQKCFDMYSALQWVEKLPQESQAKRESVKRLLDWLLINPSDPSDIGYVSVQWQISSVICREFVKALKCRMICSPLNISIELEPRERKNGGAAHDSYILYQLKNVMTNAPISQEVRLDPSHWRNVAENDFDVPLFRESIANLLEGSVLHRRIKRESVKEFPKRSTYYLDKIWQQNLATWKDELCLLTGRVGVVMPSRNAEPYRLYVSNLPTSSLQVTYEDYWDTLQRTVEFVSEIRVLAQLLESKSTSIFYQLLKSQESIRLGLATGRVRSKTSETIQLVETVTDLSRMLSYCRSLSNPQTWSRHEYAAEKAKYLLECMNVPLLLEHAEANLSSATELLDYFDDMYLTELSFDNNRRATRMSFLLAVASLGLSLLVIPSFWTDLLQMEPVIAIIGDLARSQGWGLQISLLLLIVGIVHSLIVFAGIMSLPVIALYRYLHKRHYIQLTSKPTGNKHVLQRLKIVSNARAF